MKKKSLALALLAVMSGAASAADIDTLQNLGQKQFRLFSEDLGAALSYKALSPAEPEGITGFDIGVEATVTTLENDEIFELATGGDSTTVVVVPKLHAHKGLPFGIDLGAFYAAVPDSNVNLFGAELRYAIIEGNVALPAVAVRGTYTSLDGVDQLDFSTKGLELTASKGFAMVTPYAGVGQVWVDSDPNVPDAPVPLKKESFTEAKYFLGVNVNMGLLNFALEGDQTGDATSYGAKLGFRW